MSNLYVDLNDLGSTVTIWDIGFDRKLVVNVESIFELVVGILLHHVLSKLAPHFGTIDTATILNNQIAEHLFKFEAMRIKSRIIVDISAIVPLVFLLLQLFFAAIVTDNMLLILLFLVKFGVRVFEVGLDPGFSAFVSIISFLLCFHMDRLEKEIS